MRFGTYHTFQYPPWLDQNKLFRQELERAELSEALGYDDVWIPEQHFTRYCLAGDPLQLATYVAARTRRVRIGLAVVNLVFHHPLRLAEQAAILDVLSQGRLDMGVGRGYQPIQYPIFGVAMEDTRQRFEEVLEILVRAWTTERFSFEGKFFRIPEVGILPKPYTRPHVSLLMASNSPASAEIAAQKRMPAIMARPFNANDRIASDLAFYQQKLEASGASPREVEALLDRSTVMKLVCVAPTNREAKEEPREALEWHIDMLQQITIRADQAEVPAGYEHFRERYEARARFNYDEWWENVLIYGDPQRCIEKVRELERCGVRRLLLWHGPGGVAHDKVARSMELFARHVMPAFRRAH